MSRKAVALLSGGLDSTLAVRVILEQDIGVFAVNFTSVFCTCTSNRSACRSEAVRVAEDFGIPIKVYNKGLDYMDIIRHPKYGYGKGMNPCIDCRIYMHRIAKRYMEEIGASFIFTGEVLGQRPMSQRREVFKIIERESNLEGLILRPLCAKKLEPTIPEKSGMVNRERLLDYVGRTRRPQMGLADSFDIHNYPCPSGGCLLTDKIFSRKVKDLVFNEDAITTKDLKILRIGRHFRLNNIKVVVGRNEAENTRLKNLSGEDYELIEPLDFTGPVAIVCGNINNEGKVLVGGMLLRYAGEKAKGKGRFRYVRGGMEESFSVDSPIDDKALEGIRV